MQRLKLLYFGWDYRVLLSIRRLSVGDRLRLLRDFLRIDWFVPAGCVPREAAAIAREVLEAEGGPGEYIVECGVFSGNLTSKLSILASRLRYRVAAFDSFQGVPVNDEAQTYNGFDFSGTYAVSAEQVRRNVEKYGDSRVVDYFAGWFSESMAKLPITKWRIAIVDCDQLVGTRDALDGLLQQVRDGQILFSQDYHIDHIRDFLNDPEFWRARGVVPPEFVHRCVSLASATLKRGERARTPAVK
jgi:hypothetical protein